MYGRLRTALKQAVKSVVARWRRSARHRISPAKKPYPWEASYPEGVSWRLDIKPAPLTSLLSESVCAYPDHPCLNFLGKKYNYRNVGRLVARTAKGFQDLGVRHGVRVGLCLPNSPYYVACYYGVLEAGGTVVNFNPLQAEQEIARQIRDSQTRLMVTMDLPSLYPKIAGRLNDTCLEKIIACPMSGLLRFPHNLIPKFFMRRERAAVPRDQRHVRYRQLIANSGKVLPVQIEPECNLAVLQYTGGVNGVWKGAVLTHANLYANAVQLRSWAIGALPGKEKVVAVLPLSNAFGMTGVMNFALSLGAELILLPHFKIGELLKLLHEARPSFMFGVPTIYAAIAAHKDVRHYDLSALKFCVCGGAPLALEIKSEFESITGLRVIEGYGLTEAGPVCTIAPVSGCDKPESVGLPLPGTIIDIVSLRNPQRRVASGIPGEICVSGPQVMAGYWHPEAETRQVLIDGRLRTGDIGYLDEDGYLYIIDRIKDMIISGGFNVYPRLVENVIGSHPAVDAVLICATPDHQRGEKVKAYVKLQSGAALTASELRVFMKDQLASYEIPSVIEFVTELPNKPPRKLSQRELAARVRHRRTRHAA